MLNKTETKSVIDALMTALINKPFADIQMRDVADAAGVPLAKVLMTFPTRLAIIDAFADMIDQTVLGGDDPDMVEEPVRERLFDVFMRRYDALLPHKLAIIQLERDIRRDPLLAMQLLPIAQRAMQRMAASGDVALDGARGMVVMAGLLQVQAQTMRVWLKETDDGQAQTMAELDKALRQAERRIGDLDRMMGSVRSGRMEGPLCRLRRNRSETAVQPSPDQEAAAQA